MSGSNLAKVYVAVCFVVIDTEDVLTAGEFTYPSFM